MHGCSNNNAMMLGLSEWQKHYRGVKSYFFPSPFMTTAGLKRDAVHLTLQELLAARNIAKMKGQVDFATR